ncbi:protoporphyrinogen oxidase [Nonlabens antarcticus]|uniref:protoporphyrinogen oxidase n=1 Tax=Nonlabens antarcticus TaxID=392714 RepID=UPI0018916089|nr:protoporphyrinogen oxidase [Nonlabens antarcticus]
MVIKEFYEYIVLGAGLSGLSAGYQLHKQNTDFVILEADSRAGGVIKSEFINGLLVEHGANSLVMTPAVEKLCGELGIIDDIVPAMEESKIRQILWNDQLHTLKASPLTLINTGLISSSAKLRILKEPFIKSVSPDGESVLDFFTRRFGKEVATRMAGAIVSGIYAGDAANLEIASVFPRFVELEKEYGSLLKGLKKSPSASRKIVSFKNGVETLTSSLSRKLESDIHLNSPIKSIKQFGHHWEIKLKSGTKIKAGKVISTLPYYALKKVLKQDHFPERKIAYNPMLTLQVQVNLKELQKKTKGFGFLASSFERKDFIGVMYNGNTFSTAVNGDKALINFFVRPDNCKKKDAKKIFKKLCIPLFRKWTGIDGDLELIHSKYWKKAIPQKSSGHSDWLKEIQLWESRCPNFKILGNYINGVSLGDCIEQTMKDASQF